MAVRGDRPAPPYTPQNPADAAQWHDLGVGCPASADQYSSSLNPDWRNMVDGRVVLKGGSIKGMQPADLVVQNNLFEFRKGSTPVFRQALTDPDRVRSACAGKSRHAASQWGAVGRLAHRGCWRRRVPALASD